MKKIVALVILCFLSLAIFSQSVEEIVANHFKAIGGYENWKNLQSLVLEGNSNRQGFEFPMKMTALQDKGVRLDLEIMGMENYMLVTPKGGYIFFPVQGQQSPEPMPESMFKGFSTKLDLKGELFDYANKGVKLSLEGKETVDGVEHFVLALSKSDENKKLIYINSNNYYITKEIAKYTTESGEVKEMAVKFSDYKNIDGYVLPMVTNNPLNGDITVKKYIVNSKIDEAIFQVK